MKKNDKKKKTGQKYNLYQENSVSSSDCTGLMPSNPSSEDEIESYQDLYSTSSKEDHQV